MDKQTLKELIDSCCYWKLEERKGETGDRRTLTLDHKKLATAIKARLKECLPEIIPAQLKNHGWEPTIEYADGHNQCRSEMEKRIEEL